MSFKIELIKIFIQRLKSQNVVTSGENSEMSDCWTGDRQTDKHMLMIISSVHRHFHNVIITEAAANHGASWTQPRSLSVTTTPGEKKTTDTDGVVLNHTCVNKHTTPATPLISQKNLVIRSDLHKPDVRKGRRRLKPLLF